MNCQERTSISGKHHPENHKGEGNRPSSLRSVWPHSPALERLGGGMNSARIAELCSPSAGTAP